MSLAYLPLLSSHRRLGLLLNMSIYTNRKDITIMASTTSTLSAKRHLSLIEFLLVIVGIPLAVMAVMWSYNDFTAHAAPNSITGVSSMSQQKIDGVLCKAKSTACGTGQDIVN